MTNTPDETLEAYIQGLLIDAEPDVSRSEETGTHNSGRNETIALVDTITLVADGKLVKPSHSNNHSESAQNHFEKNSDSRPEGQSEGGDEGEGIDIIRSKKLSLVDNQNSKYSPSLSKDTTSSKTPAREMLVSDLSTCKTEESNGIKAEGLNHELATSELSSERDGGIKGEGVIHDESPTAPAKDSVSAGASHQLSRATADNALGENRFGGITEYLSAQPPHSHEPELVLKSKHAPSIQEQVALLEEHKRQKLQEMLSRQALPKVKPVEAKTEVKARVEAKPATDTKLDLDTRVTDKTTSETATKPVLKVTAPDTKIEADTRHLDHIDTQVVVESATEEAQGVYKLLEWGENGRPIWAEGEFDALFFDVAGLTLAVPLVALGQIVNLNKKPTSIAGQSEWFMGMFSTSLGDLRTVNTALFVMPERYNPEFLNTAKFIISIDGLPWGLAVDKVNQPVRLKPEDVNWRTERGKRPWLAGTVKSKMCALIDIPQMAKLLDQSDRNRRT